MVTVVPVREMLPTPYERKFKNEGARGAAISSVPPIDIAEHTGACARNTPGRSKTSASAFANLLVTQLIFITAPAIRGARPEWTRSLIQTGSHLPLPRFVIVTFLSAAVED